MWCEGHAISSSPCLTCARRLVHCHHAIVGIFTEAHWSGSRTRGVGTGILRHIFLEACLHLQSLCISAFSSNCLVPSLHEDSCRTKSKRPASDTRTLYRLSCVQSYFSTLRGGIAASASLRCATEDSCARPGGGSSDGGAIRFRIPTAASLRSAVPAAYGAAADAAAALATPPRPPGARHGVTACRKGLATSCCVLTAPQRAP